MAERICKTEAFLRQLLAANPTDDCVTWPYYCCNGYARFGRNGKNRLVHRYVCEQVNGPPPTPKHEAAHSCGKGHEGCVNPRHLAWKTTTENQRDRIEHGTTNRGKANGLNKLTEKQVLAIFADQRTHDEIAADYLVTANNVYCIKVGRSWSWLTGATKETWNATKPDHTPKGERHGRSKLTEAEVLAIFADRRHRLIVAEKYGVSEAAVRDIWKGKRWAWLTSAAS